MTLVDIVQTARLLRDGRIHSNFHEVDEGRFYRSAQMIMSMFEEKVGQYNIQTVIDLNGTRKHISEEEERWCEQNGITYHHVPLRLDLLEANLVLRTINIIKESDKPLLIHCKSGSDRTGLMSAIYMIDFKQEPELALSQLSFKYLHCKIFQPHILGIIKQYMASTHNGTHTSFEEWFGANYKNSVLTNPLK